LSAVVSLCDLTGNMVRPYIEAGFDAYLVDPQHGFSSSAPSGFGGTVYKLARTVLEALPELGMVKDVAAVFAFPPCTDMAVSGARWFESKKAEDPAFFGKAISVAEQCRSYALTTGAPFFIENPVSTLSSVFGKPTHTFHPWHFSGLEPDDDYTKKTCLWSGGGFVMPRRIVDPLMGEPDNRIHMATPGPERMNFRSATPMGFARAVFLANCAVIT
jgi:hypothetical protein